MEQKEIVRIVNKVYPLISKDNNCDAKIEYHYNIYERLSGEKGMTGEVCAHAEYDWSTNKIYLYTSRMNSVEDIVRSLIHECVHSRQLKCTFDSFYENGHTYDTHPYEIQARSAEEEWEIYLNEIKK
tara:strand:- start:202 stop:582 length:381 start_codon:yes stop_codon:yes gene_type:complete